MVEAINENSRLHIQRDARGRVISEDQDGHQVQSKYDKPGRRMEMVSSLGAAVNISRNAAGYINQLQAVNQEGASWEAQYGYNILGLETERLLPGGILATFQYDRAGRPVEQAVNNSSRSLRHRIYAWNVNDRLQSMMNGLTRGLVQYSYDEFANLAWAKYEDNTFDCRQADHAKNFYRTKDQRDRKYGPGGRLLSANGTQYEYDEAGDLVLKTTNTGEQWCYEWLGNGMLKKVIRPDGKAVSFEYDALGRRTAKLFDGYITRWVWDGNTPLHEWKYALKERPVTVIDEWGDVHKDKVEPVTNMITWVFDEGAFRPAGKIQGTQRYSILTDYLGTPVDMYDGAGNPIWSVEYDIYGKVRKQNTGNAVDCPFRLQGQYEDAETGLYYNRYRYYAPDEGIYISKDPIGLEGGLALYAFVDDPNSQTDIFGLYIYYQLKDKYGNVVYHGITERDLEDRTKEHARDGKTFTQVTYVDDLDDRVAARDLEGSALYHARDKVLQNAERPVTPGYYHSYDPDNLKEGRTMKTAKQISLKMKTGKTVKVDDAGKIKCK
ncbi:RHS repeat-associated core domain-containing protein [Paraflavitalea speifideaquila]|uniref:RHS repeat domain-containing protein n=1 Tax=Paraflavitalea speifideaquila TaxID=3076558 RepID=UPI0028E7F407|nr:RHS repeat-associated core domain-containing protein [Paraflavitalea speifideiaquila]